jgi:nucleoside-diphosphate-sugar epimerase
LPLEDVDAVVLAVGFDRTAGPDMRAVYVDGLAAVLTEFASRSVSPRLVQIGSTGVYGQSGGEEVDESAPTEPAEESGRVVLEAERTLIRHRPDAVRLRFAGIYGPGRLIGSSTLRDGAPITGDPEKWLNLIHVEDGARAVWAAVERGQPGAVYNVSDDRPVRRGEFYHRLASVLGVPAPRFVRPDPALPAREQANRRIVNRRMREELGVKLRYPSFEEGLAASV